MIQPKMKLIVIKCVVSLRSFWQKWNFIFCDKTSCKHYPNWNHMKRNICTCANKSDWLFLNRPFISDQPRNEISFCFARNEKWCKKKIFSDGLKFHFGQILDFLILVFLLISSSSYNFCQDQKVVPKSWRILIRFTKFL